MLNPPSPALEGFLLSAARLIRTEHPGAGRNGRPGSPGSRLMARAQERGACRRERGASRIPMAERSSTGTARAAQLRRDKRLFCYPVSRASRGSTDAGGEDVGYFAPMERAGSNPAFDSRTVEVALQGPPRATAPVSSRKDASELMSLTPRSPVPQRALRLSMHRIGRAVAKMSVTSERRSGAERVRGPCARKGENSIASSPPTASTVRGEDR